jgi:hypothetical protein
MECQSTPLFAVGAPRDGPVDGVLHRWVCNTRNKPSAMWDKATRGFGTSLFNLPNMQVSTQMKQTCAAISLCTLIIMVWSACG